MLGTLHFAVKLRINWTVSSIWLWKTLIECMYCLTGCWHIVFNSQDSFLLWVHCLIVTLNIQLQTMVQTITAVILIEASKIRTSNKAWIWPHAPTQLWYLRTGRWSSFPSWFYMAWKYSVYILFFISSFALKKTQLQILLRMSKRFLWMFKTNEMFSTISVTFRVLMTDHSRKRLVWFKCSEKPF